MKVIFGILFIISIISLIGYGIGIYNAYSAPKGRIIFYVLIAITLISMGGFGLALKTTYKAHQQIYTINQFRHQLESKQKMIDSINRGMNKQLLFIHHSVGRSWLDQGGLAEELTNAGLGVHNATYGDFIGEQTDINHWVPKFRDYMDKIVKYNYYPDKYYDGDRENDIIMFKSCFPNSNIGGTGTAPGNPIDPAKTLWNYKATFNALQDYFVKYPSKIFIYITAPPLVPAATSSENAQRAREFNNWVKGEFVEKYRIETNLNNVLVFDLFDVLADENNLLKKEYRPSERDSHPKSNGMKIATKLFIEFLRANNIIDSE